MEEKKKKYWVIGGIAAVCIGITTPIIVYYIKKSREEELEPEEIKPDEPIDNLDDYDEYERKRPLITEQKINGNQIPSDTEQINNNQIKVVSDIPIDTGTLDNQQRPIGRTGQIGSQIIYNKKSRFEVFETR